MRRLPVGLALSGGTVKAVLHIGVIKALIEEQVPIDYIAGTSGGSIVATIYASGASMDEMENIATNLSWWKLASVRLTRLGFVTSKPIEKFMQKTLLVQNFEDLSIPCVVPLTELTTGKRVMYRSGLIARVVRASCSIPQIYLPVEIDGGYYVDGGLAEYVPVQSVQSLGNQFTVAVNLSSRNEKYQKPAHILQLILQITNMIARQNVAQSIAKADFVIHPDIEKYSAFDFGKAQDLVDLGYAVTKQNIQALRVAWHRKNSLLERLRGRFVHR